MNHVSARATILELLMTAAKGLVDLTNIAEIEFEVGDGVTVFKIDVHKDDQSNFMGKAGTHMRALGRSVTLLLKNQTFGSLLSSANEAVILKIQVGCIKSI